MYNLKHIDYYVPLYQIEHYYDTLLASDRLHNSFIDCQTMSRIEYTHWVYDISIPKFFAYENGIVKGMVHLTDLRGKHGKVHFSLCPNVKYQEILKVMRFMIKSLLFMQDNNGEYLLDALTGLTPITNQPAIKALKHIGANIIGIVPLAIYDFENNINIDGLLSSYTRDGIGGNNG